MRTKTQLPDPTLGVNRTLHRIDSYRRQQNDCRTLSTQRVGCKSYVALSKFNPKLLTQTSPHQQDRTQHPEGTAMGDYSSINLTPRSEQSSLNGC